MVRSSAGIMLTAVKRTVWSAIIPAPLTLHNIHYANVAKEIRIGWGRLTVLIEVNVFKNHRSIANALC